MSYFNGNTAITIAHFDIEMSGVSRVSEAGCGSRAFCSIYCYLNFHWDYAPNWFILTSCIMVCRRLMLLIPLWSTSVRWRLLVQKTSRAMQSCFSNSSSISTSSSIWGKRRSDKIALEGGGRAVHFMNRRRRTLCRTQHNSLSQRHSTQWRANLARKTWQAVSGEAALHAQN